MIRSGRIGSDQIRSPDSVVCLLNESRVRARCVRCRQRGFVRTNCIDCLDRTNALQTLMGVDALGMQLDLVIERLGLVERYGRFSYALPVPVPVPSPVPIPLLLSSFALLSPLPLGFISFNMLYSHRRGGSGPNPQGAQLQQRCVEAARACWMTNGDYIAHIYTGTGALGGGRSRIKDAALSTKRAFQNSLLGIVL